MDKGRWQKGRLTKRVALYMIMLVFIVISVVEGAGVLRVYYGMFGKDAEERKFDKYYVMITGDRKSSFWRAIYEGAYEKGLEVNAYVDFLGDKPFEQYTKGDLMNIAIASGVDGIIVVGDDSQELENQINEARDKEIPVITLYNDSPQSKRSSFVGIAAYNLGNNYGKKVLEIIEENEDLRKKETPIQVMVLVNSYAQDSGQNVFCTGIQETLEGDEETEVELSIVSVDDAGAFSAEEAIRQIFLLRELPDFMICLNETNTTGVYQAVVDYNRVGKVHILGYYDSKAIVKAIDRNVIDSTVSIDTAQMGKFCIDALTEYHEVGATSQYFTADITMIDKRNVWWYLKEAEDEE